MPVIPLQLMRATVITVLSSAPMGAELKTASRAGDDQGHVDLFSPGRRGSDESLCVSIKKITKNNSVFNFKYSKEIADLQNLRKCKVSTCRAK